MTLKKVYYGVPPVLDDAFAKVLAILAAERIRRQRQIGLSEFVRDLQAGI